MEKADFCGSTFTNNFIFFSPKVSVGFCGLRVNMLFQKQQIGMLINILQQLGFAVVVCTYSALHIFMQPLLRMENVERFYETPAE